jgi:hypothetical protein
VGDGRGQVGIASDGKGKRVVGEEPLGQRGAYEGGLGVGHGAGELGQLFADQGPQHVPDRGRALGQRLVHQRQPLGRPEDADRLAQEQLVLRRPRGQGRGLPDHALVGRPIARPRVGLGEQGAGGDAIGHQPGRLLQVLDRLGHPPVVDGDEPPQQRSDCQQRFADPLSWESSLRFVLALPGGVLPLPRAGRARNVNRGAARRLHQSPGCDSFRIIRPGPFTGGRLAP